jgi:hypothetical protein
VIDKSLKYKETTENAAAKKGKIHTCSMVVILVSLPSSKIGSSTAEVGLSILSFSAFL